MIGWNRLFHRLAPPRDSTYNPTHPVQGKDPTRRSIDLAISCYIMPRTDYVTQRETDAVDCHRMPTVEENMILEQILRKITSRIYESKDLILTQGDDDDNNSIRRICCPDYSKDDEIYSQHHNKPLRWC